MKNLSSLINTLLICILVFVVLLLGLPNSPALADQGIRQANPDSQAGCDASRSVLVNGSAVVNVIPDRVMIQLGVQSNAATTRAVEEANTAAIKEVIQTLKGLGIQPKDIATDWYVIEPIYESYDSLYIKGYRINNMISVTLRDVSQVSKVIAAALESGANQALNVEFFTSELRQYRDQARQLAMQAAIEKAQALANAANAETGCVLSINENTWSTYNGWWYGRDHNLWSQNTIQNAAPVERNTSDSEPVSLGQISVRAEVGVTFGLK